VLKLGEEIGGLQEDLWRTQIKHTVKRQLEKELQLRGRGVKVLSLFFIDRVANYRDYARPGPRKASSRTPWRPPSRSREGRSATATSLDQVAYRKGP